MSLHRIICSYGFARLSPRLHPTQNPFLEIPFRSRLSFVRFRCPHFVSRLPDFIRPEFRLLKICQPKPSFHFQKAIAFLSFHRFLGLIVLGGFATRHTGKFSLSWIIAFGSTFTLRFQKAIAFLSLRQVRAFSGSLALLFMLYKMLRILLARDKRRYVSKTHRFRLPKFRVLKFASQKQVFISLSLSFTLFLSLRRFTSFQPTQISPLFKYKENSKYYK